MTWQRDEPHAARHAVRTSARLKPDGAARVSDSGANRRDSAKPGRAPLGLAHQDEPNRDHEGYLIKELQQLLRTQIEARIRARGLWLSFPHSAVLMTLNEEPGLSGAQLARRCSVTAQTMNGLLVPLEKKGMIERRPDPENARVLRCFVKAEGTEVMQRGMHEARAVFKLMLGALSNREREEFRSILRRCIHALQANAEHVAQDDISRATARAHAAHTKMAPASAKRKPKK